MADYPQRTIGERFLAALHPWRCVLCRSVSDQGMDLCRACAADLPELAACCGRCAEPLPVAAELCGRCQQRPPAYDRVLAGFCYQPPLEQLVTAFKYRRQMAAGRVLAECTARKVAAALAAGAVDAPDALLPVPLHHWRLLRRGFNQSWLIAADIRRHLKRSSNISPALVPGLLRRRRRTRPQAGLALAERRKNLRHAFACRGSPPAHVALVDDVMTSGTTLEACARALKRAGCRRVDVWVVARAAQDRHR